MKRLLPLLAGLLGLAFLASGLLPPRNSGAFDLVGFGRLPVLADGRIKPLDTVARSSLLLFQGNQQVKTPDGNKPLPDREGKPITPLEWLLDLFYRQDRADTYAVFTIDNPDLLSLIGKTEDSLKIPYPTAAERTEAAIGILNAHYRQFSFAEISSHLAAIDDQAKLADPVDDAARTPFQRAVVQLRNELVVYKELENTVQVPGADDFLGELMRFQQFLPDGVAAVRAQQEGKPHNEDDAATMMAMAKRYAALSEATNILAIPPDTEKPDINGWTNAGHALLQTFDRGSVDPSVLAYAGLGYAWRGDNADEFNKLVDLYRADLAKRLAPELKKGDVETRFNAAAPFFKSLTIYVFAFVLGIVSWLVWPEALGRAAYYLVIAGWIGATAGILTRMWIDGRPPVTNLYSSALFIGWGAAGLCIVLEYLYRNAIGSVAAGFIGFGTLLIAHYLSLSGDTLEMMRAVLDSNFWLGTHVVVVTSGYASTFLAGFLALIYIVRGVLTTSLDKATADSLSRMVYGIICFATLFSFAGTVLGGIWADQSWGRFWGWDPKENGALIIVLWNALILHARWGGLIRRRGLMCLAVFGNIVTSWSWFGVNMLGIGLHSYGFTEAAFWLLSIFVATQLAFIALGNVPLSKWRSAPGMA